MHLQTDNYHNCQFTYLIFLRSFYCLKVPSRLTTSSQGNAENGVSESPVSKISRECRPPDPLKVRAFGTRVRAYGGTVSQLQQELN